MYFIIRTVYSLSQDFFAAHFDDFIKNIHTCERRAIKMDDRENFQDIFIDTLTVFTRNNLQKRKQIS